MFRPLNREHTLLERSNDSRDLLLQLDKRTQQHLCHIFSLLRGVTCDTRSISTLGYKAIN